MIKPHGADSLLPLLVTDAEERRELLAEAEGLPSLLLNSAAAANAVMLGGGYFTPLTGFMNLADSLSVADLRQSQCAFAKSSCSPRRRRSSDEVQGMVHRRRNSSGVTRRGLGDAPVRALLGNSHGTSPSAIPFANLPFRSSATPTGCLRSSQLDSGGSAPSIEGARR